MVSPLIAIREDLPLRRLAMTKLVKHTDRIHNVYTSLYIYIYLLFVHVCRMVSSSSDIFASFCRVAPDKKKERKEPERKKLTEILFERNVESSYRLN